MHSHSHDKQEIFSGQKYWQDSLSASRDFCHLLMTCANNVDPDQAEQNFASDLILTVLYSVSIPERFLLWSIVKKKSADE